MPPMTDDAQREAMDMIERCETIAGSRQTH
jgi:hypothetical protein